jgi:uncharacterized protein
MGRVILPDVNVLLNAFRHDGLDFEPSRQWLRAVVSDASPYGISPQVLNSVVRIATNRKTFAQPYLLEEVFRFCNFLLDQPHCQIVQPGPGHWQIFCDLCRGCGAKGNLVQDAWFAALAIDSGCEWITHDRDFAKFPGLRWRPPF